jgi:hypothetical protein
MDNCHDLTDLKLAEDESVDFWSNDSPPIMSLTGMVHLFQCFIGIDISTSVTYLCHYNYAICVRQFFPVENHCVDSTLSCIQKSHVQASSE